MAHHDKTGGDKLISAIQSITTINGNGRSNILIGDSGDNFIDGKGGNDLLFGRDGNDFLQGGSGADFMVGGRGNDAYFVDSRFDVVFELPGGGVDEIRSTISYSLKTQPSIEGLTLLDSGNINGTGNALDNVITGNAGNNILDGQGGNDTLYGGGGNNTFFGRAGDDTMVLGPGDPVRVDGGSGIDTVSTEAVADAGYYGPVLDLTGALEARFKDIEILDLGPYIGGTTLVLDRAAAIKVSGDGLGAETLVVKGGLFGQVEFTDFGWVKGTAVVDPFGIFGAYQTWTNQSVTVLVQDFVAVFAPNPGDIDLETLTPSQGYTMEGAAIIGSAGDVNGDGFDDVIVGAPKADPFGRTDAGQSYVIYGQAGERDSFDLSTLTAADGFRISGATAGDDSGRSVASVGDVNGDGFGDIIVGAPLADPDGRNNAGLSYVIFGKEGGPGDIDLAALTPAQGFSLKGELDLNGPSGHQSGSSVGAAGDLNADGIDDFFVDGQVSYIIYGSATGPGSIDLASLPPSQGVRITGSLYGGFVTTLASAGDINGDGIDDLVVSRSRFNAYDRDRSGQTYVIYGRTGGIGDVDLDTLTAAQGFKISGANLFDTTGYALSSAGDINGDGFTDLIIGSLPVDGSGFYDPGIAYVIYGKAGGHADIDLAAFSPADGFKITSNSFLEFTSTSVSGAGDVNGDGIDDLIVDGAHVIYGKLGGLGDIDIGSLTPDQGFDISAGNRVSGAGDVNGDGFSDLILGTGPDVVIGQGPFGPTNQSHIIYGGDFTGAVTHLGTAGDDTLAGTEADEKFVGGLGNDVMVGGGGADSFHGGAGNDQIVLGFGEPLRVDGGNGVDTVQADGFGFLLDLTGTLRTKFQSIEILDLSGSEGNYVVLDSQSAAQLSGSNGTAFGANTLLVKGDGDHVDLADFGWVQGADVTDPFGNTGSYTAWHNGAGTVLVESDVSVSANVLALATLSPTRGFTISGGSSVSDAGDVNADGFADFAVNAGKSTIFYGTAAGLGDVDLAAFTSSQGFVVSRTVPGDDAGLDVRAAGDVNGDGIDDLILGSTFADPDGRSDAGETYVVFGKAGGPGDIDVATMSAAEGFKISGAAAGDWSGLSADDAGDFNGDGIHDLVIGAQNADPFGRNDAGETYVIFGKASGFGDIDLAALAPAQGFKISGAFDGDNLGHSVSNAGDINGDGLADLVIGAPFTGGAQIGFAYVVYGTQSASDIDLAALTPSQGFTISGFFNDDLLGVAVTGLHDINGDGIDDFAVSAERGDGGGGVVYFLYGKEGGLGDVDLTTLTDDQGFKASTSISGALIGRSVSAAGDVNGDGLNDVIIGAPRIDALGHFLSGESFVVYGQEGTHGSIDLGKLTPDQGFAIAGAGDYDGSGQSVSGAGDINGDGFADLMVGAPYADGPGGESYVIYGGNFTGSVTHQGTKGDDTLNGTAAAENFVGGLGNDEVFGGGGADAFHGGSGDDAIHVADSGFRSVDGGGGFDTLALDFAGAIDFGNLAGRVSAVEAIDADNGASNAMTLHLADVLAIDAKAPDLGGEPSLDNVLKLDGNAGDTLSLAAADGWGAADTGVLAGYAVYTAQSVKIAVDQDIAVSVS